MDEQRRIQSRIDSESLAKSLSTPKTLSPSPNALF